jgi:hypothetical protein
MVAPLLKYFVLAKKCNRSPNHEEYYTKKANIAQVLVLLAMGR